MIGMVWYDAVISAFTDADTFLTVSNGRLALHFELHQAPLATPVFLSVPTSQSAIIEAKASVM